MKRLLAFVNALLRKSHAATARRDKTKEVWLESGQREELVATSPGAFRFLARPMQLKSTETPHQSRKNSLEAFSESGPGFNGRRQIAPGKEMGRTQEQGRSLFGNFYSRTRTSEARWYNEGITVELKVVRNRMLCAVVQMKGAALHRSKQWQRRHVSGTRRTSSCLPSAFGLRVSVLSR
jgi:hypothetical protein